MLNAERNDAIGQEAEYDRSTTNNICDAKKNADISASRGVAAKPIPA